MLSVDGVVGMAGLACARSGGELDIFKAGKI